MLLSSKVGVNTTHLVTQCLCNHLTFFGSSFFVTPNLVDPSRTAELFASFGENPVVVCFVVSLFGAYLLVVVWARRKDVQDTAKVWYISPATEYNSKMQSHLQNFSEKKHMICCWLIGRWRWPCLRTTTPWTSTATCWVSALGTGEEPPLPLR